MVLLACACGNQNDTQDKQAPAAGGTGQSTEPATNATTTPDAATSNAGTSTNAATADVKAKAIELIAQSDCLTCHTIDEKKVGPAYREVANKYVADQQTITLLAGKVIKGGAGVWGQIPMTPHPNISEEDAKTMVTYILSLKK